MNKPLLQATDLKKVFRQPKPVTILNGVDLTVQRGETVAIIGRSGEGKSTLLQILGTLENPCSGILEIAGEIVSSSNKAVIRNKNIGFVFQSFHLLEDYSALENVLIPARIARENTSKGSPAYERAIDLLEKVGLSNRANYFTKLLSGGEKQRVALARAMCNNPDLIFADEPSGNLDAHTGQLIHNILLNFAKEPGRSLVIVTHDRELANLCDKRFELTGGKLQST